MSKHFTILRAIFTATLVISLITACENQPVEKLTEMITDTDQSSTTPPENEKIISPAITLNKLQIKWQPVHYSNRSTYPILGTCNDEISEISVQITSIGFSQTISCSNDSFSASLDLSSVTTDGTIDLVVTQQNSQGTAVTDSMTIATIVETCSDDTRRGYTSQFADGDGSMGNPYKICTATQFNLLSSLYTNGDYVELHDSLDFSSSSTGAFSLGAGRFNGNFLQMKNVLANVNQSFFGSISSGSLQNIWIDNAHLTITAGGKRCLVASALNGASLMNEVLITQSSISLDPSVTTRLNEVCGVVFDVSGSASLTNIDADIDLILHNANAGATAQWIGGIFGDYLGSGLIENITYRGTLQVGNSGTTTSSVDIGGICSWINTTVGQPFNNWKNLGSMTVYRGTRVSGLIANFDDIGSSSIEVSQLHNEASIVTYDSSVVGGLFGHITEDILTIKECSNKGDITGTSASQAGGITALAEGITLSECFNSGNISGGQVGGLIYQSLNLAVNINNSFNTGAVSGTTLASGIIADTTTSTSATNVFNYGSITSPGTVEAIGYSASNFNTCSDCFYNSSLGTAATQGTALLQSQMNNLNNFTNFSSTIWQFNTNVTQNHISFKWQEN